MVCDILKENCQTKQSRDCLKSIGYVFAYSICPHHMECQESCSADFLSCVLKGWLVVTDFFTGLK